MGRRRNFSSATRRELLRIVAVAFAGLAILATVSGDLLGGGWAATAGLVAYLTSRGLARPQRSLERLVYFGAVSMLIALTLIRVLY
jgi:uncharacterized membrane protein YjjP (DUF1212 family)